MKVLGFIGSLRERSFNKALMAAARERWPKEWEFELGDFSSFALFNEDIEHPVPVDVSSLKEKIRKADGILMVTPEYNRSIPGGLKNMLDWTSRGDDDPWPSKRVYILGASTGNLGTVTAQYDLRRIMLYFGARVLGTPEFFLNRAEEKFDATPTLTDEATLKRLDVAMKAFVDFIQHD